jgi:hypothetical protein
MSRDKIPGMSQPGTETPAVRIRTTGVAEFLAA